MMENETHKRKLISIVVPVHNEQECIPALYEALCRQMEQMDYRFEFIFVNDGSTDQSAEIIGRLHADDERVKMIAFSRNYGHQVALTAGMHFANGNAVISMDADMQHPPELIPEFVKRWEKGVLIVDTIKQQTATGGLKSVLTRSFYKVFNKISKIKIDPLGSDFRLLDRVCVDAINAHNERSPFIRGLTQSIGFRREVIEFQTGRRFGGEPSYDLRRLSNLALNGIFSFSNLPLKMAFFMGMVMILVCLIYISVSVVMILSGIGKVQGWLSLILATVLMGSINLLFTGILSVYVAKIFEQVRDRPVYLVKETVGINEPLRHNQPPAV